MNPEKSKMEKGNLVKAFHSQFDQEIPPILQRTTCGIASLYTALSYLGRDLPSYPEFLKKYVEHGSYNIPVHTVNLPIGRGQVKVPIAYAKPGASLAEENTEVSNALSPFSNLPLNAPIERSFDPNQEPKRSFTIANGFDHRGIDSFLKEELGIDDISVEIRESDKLPDVLPENSVILASVIQSKLGYPARLTTFRSSIATHVVQIVQIGELNNSKVALFSDPAFLNTHDGLQVREVESFESSLAGKYTILTDSSQD